MYTSLFDQFFADSFVTPYKTVYVISDSQLDELKSHQHQKELENIEVSRKRLEENFQSRIKILDERKKELRDALKVLSPAVKEKVSS
tara:strand:- start:140 stop:400 length:261 start_codon:yes stop_codon:yes gene_type:complete